MKCEKVIGSMVALLDDEVEEEERAQLEAHLGACVACQGELHRLRATRAVVTRQLAAAVGAGSFDDLWRRVEADTEAPATLRVERRVVRDIRSARRAAARRLGDRAARRLPGWAGLGGLAAAAVLALAVFGLQPAQQVGQAPEPEPAVEAVRTEPAQPAPPAREPAARSRVAAAPAPDAEERATTVAAAPQDAPVAEAGAGAEPDLVPEDEEDEIAAVATNETEPPRELLERPDLFLDFPIVRKLDELRNFDAVLAESPDDGGAG